MRQFFDKQLGLWLDEEEYAFRKSAASHNGARSDLPAPMLINDTMEKPIQSMVDGKYYDSKARLRETYKPSGNKEGKRYVEMGNDPSITKPYKKPKPDRNGIKASVRRAFSQAGLGA
jgi:hypothetical protein